ncbi:Hypothetical predicted protein, partial [Olea europaea subsp. europaea]
MGKGQVEGRGMNDPEGLALSLRERQEHPRTLSEWTDNEYSNKEYAEDIRQHRVRRDASDVTTLYVDPSPGRYNGGVLPAVGVLSSTARTFVQDGATTEFATQVVGTTLDNGAYAQLLSTSSRVFYDLGDAYRVPQNRGNARIRSTAPVLVFATNTYNNLRPVAASRPFGLGQSGVLFQTPVNSIAPSSSTAQTAEPSVTPPDSWQTQDDAFLTEPPLDKKKPGVLTNDLDELFSLSETRNSLNNVVFVNAERDTRDYVVENADRNIDLYKKRETDKVTKLVPEENNKSNEVKPAKVIAPQVDLPTFTVRHDFAPSAFSSEEVHVESSESRKNDSPSKTRPRTSKALFRGGIPMKPLNKKLDTVTYHGFVDFTTTVGDTVIIFMPNTAPAGVKPAATRGPEDDMEVVTNVKTFMSHTPGMMTRTVTGHSLTMQTSLPTMVVEPEPSSRRQGKNEKSVYEPVAVRVAEEKEDFAKKSSVLAREQAFEPASVKLQPSQVIQPSETYNPGVSSSSSEDTETAQVESFRPTEPLPTYSTRVQEERKKAQPLGLLRTIDDSVVNAGTTTLYKKSVIGTRLNGSYREVVETSSRVFFFLDDIPAPTIEPTSVQEPNKPQTIFSHFVGGASEVTTNPPTTEADEISTIPPEVTTPESDDISNEVESVKKGSAPRADPEQPEQTQNYLTRVVPSTVYKTFTYLTTFFIPAEGTLTTTSIKSREVTSSDVIQVTKVIKNGVDRIEPTQSPEISVTPQQQPTPESPPEEPATTTTEKSTTTERTTSTSTTTTTTTTTPPPTTTTSTTTTTTEKEEVTTPEITTIKDVETTTNKEPEELTTVDAPVTTTTSTTTSKPEEEIPKTTPAEDEEELEVIYKTLYTTYTYLTTFFEESTTSVASREVIVTNVVSSTIDPAIFASEAGLLFEDSRASSDYLMTSSEEPKIMPTSVGAGRPTTKYYPDVSLSPEEGDLFSSVIESVDVEKELSTPTAAFNSAGIVEDASEEQKTYYTTYTYFTTIFVDGETTVSSRTQVYSNVISPTEVTTIESTEAVKQDIKNINANNIAPTDDEDEDNNVGLAKSLYLKSTPAIPHSSTVSRNDPDNEDSSEESHTEASSGPRYTTMTRNTDNSVERDDQNVLNPTTVRPRKGEDEVSVIETMVTDVTSSTSGGKKMQRKILDVIDSSLDDQISSESNTEEIEPSFSPAFLLQTSFTTFTYFTTVYKGSTSSDIISRLETVTNVVTETITPTEASVFAEEDATLPITYFTTFTYWTTLYKEGNTLITSREETISNVVTPTVSASSTTVDAIEVTPTPVLESSVEPTPPIVPEAKLEPTTFYTTYTYFTTSYIGDSTILKSRLETVTNIVDATIAPTETEDENALQTGRAIGTSAAPAEQEIKSSDKAVESATKTADTLPTGLLSTIVTSSVNEGTTTLFSTDVFGTYIDGLYAQVLESTTRIETAIEPSQTQAPNLQPTGVVSINEGSIVDAEGVTTTYFTTKAIGTYVEQLYAQVVESTSSIKIDEEKSTQVLDVDPTVTVAGKTFKTGLVRLIEGSIIKDHTTTFYESRVIGTLIDNRYAQIIESTSSFKVDVQSTADPSSALTATEIMATATVATNLNIQPSASLTTSAPSPDVIESSMGGEGSGDEGEEEGEEEGSGEDDGSGVRGRVPSRLAFSTRKRTFTPTIRPFSSRNRPTFLPRRKTEKATSATTITRNLLTPTITATPAAKPNDANVIGSPTRGRFVSNRRQSSALYSSAIDVKPTAAPPQGSRRFSGRTRSSSAIVAPTPSSAFSRGRASTSGRSSPSPSSSSIAGSSRRGGFAFSNRASSSRPSPSEHPYRASASPVSGNSRFRIRPTSALPGRGGSSAHPASASHIHDNTLGPEDNDLGSTTIVTEETPAITAAEEQETPAPQTTTESSRRSNNPLLRFRRPPLQRTAPSTTTPKPASSPSPRRGVLGRRQGSVTPSTTTTTSRPTRPKPLPAIANGRQRPASNLFPKRGLFRKPVEEEEKKEEEIIEEEDKGEGEDGAVGDNEYEGSEHANAESSSTAATVEEPTRPSRRGKTLNPVSIRPFASRRPGRSKRQTSEYGGRGDRGYSGRYRRPTSRAQPAQERIDSLEEYYDDVTEPVKVSHNSGRFTPRPRNPPANHQTYQNPQTNHRVRPTTASSNTGRSQFTLREKSPTTAAPRSSFRRPTSSPRRRTSSYQEVTQAPVRARPPRLRQQSYQQTEATPSYQRTSNRRGYSSSRGRTTSRGRYRGDTVDDTFVAESRFDGTITVTHKIPSEVTIPIFNGKVTEYKNVLTAKPSLQVLGPHQYTSTVGKDGSTVIQLTNEITSTQPGGFAEVTKFILHETPTTSVTFTPTVIRGRKTSFSHVIPSTVYDVEQVVSTVTPQFGPNAPLANILLSQLLLGNLGLQPGIGLQPNINPLLGINSQPQTPATPTTEFKTKTTTYVTTITDQTSTVLPITYRGKQILTTLIDSSVQVITATEFITETVVVTPTATLPPGSNQLNSLLLPALLQAQLLQQNAGPALSAELTPGKLVIDDDVLENQAAPKGKKEDPEADVRPARDSEEEDIDSEELEEAPAPKKTVKPKFRPALKNKAPEVDPVETSIVTIYVSGRHPG